MPRKKIERTEDDARSQSSDRDLEADEREHPYYYDDAHGYEDFDPEADEEEEKKTAD